MYLVFTTIGDTYKKNKNYLQIRNDNNNVYTIKICSMYKLCNKTIGVTVTDLGTREGEAERRPARNQGGSPSEEKILNFSSFLPKI